MIYTCDNGYLLHERASQYWASGSGWLSMKTFVGGRALYNAGGGSVAVDTGSYLVLNDATPYTITIESASEVESCCVFWTPAAAAHAYAALTTSDVALLNDPAARGHVPVLVERSFRSSDALSGMAATLRATANAGAIEPAWLDEHLCHMLNALWQGHQQVLHEIAALPSARAATRAELYRRVHLARDFADAALERPVRLAELAAIAGMSPNHLLRSFHQLFGCTPLHYLRQRRIELACSLLRETDRSVADICLAVGLESFSSFTRTFRRHTGASPSAYRAAHRRRQ